MGLGNGNGKQGNKGSNFNFELRHLQLIGQLAAAVPPPPGTLATEATLLSVLNNMIASQDIEILLVRDTGNADQVVQQIREYDQGTGVWSTRYEDVNGAAYVPVGPLVYIDPSGILNLILTELLDQGLTLDAIDTNTDGLEALLTAIDAVLDNIKLDTANLDVALSTRASEATLLSTNALLTTIDAVLDTIKTDTGAMVVDLAAIEVLITSTNALLTTIDGVLDAIKLDTANLDVALSTRATEATLSSLNSKFTAVSRTPNMLRVTAAGAASIAAGARSACVWNYGNTNATVLGQTLGRGEKVCWSAEGEEDTLGAISYNADTSSLLITWTV